MSDLTASEKIGELVQAYLKGFLESDSLFSDITVLTNDEGDLQSQMQKALGVWTQKDGKCGICVLIQLPAAGDLHPNVSRGPTLMHFSFLVMENRELNKDTANGGTGKRAVAIADRIHNMMKNHRAGGLIMSFLPDGDPNQIPRAMSIEAEAGSVRPLIAYEVKFKGAKADYTIPSVVAAPTIAATSISTTTGVPIGTAGDMVTLACPTAGVEIYYTTDLTHPGATNPNAVLYSAPFVVPACTLMVRAHKADFFGSDCIAAKFT